MAKIHVFIIFCLFASNLNAQNSSEINTLIEQKHYSQALAKIDQRLIKNPLDQELLNSKALSEYKLDRIEQAITSYRRIIKLYPLYPDAYNNLAGIYAKQGKLDQAKIILERGINTNKSYALLHNNIKSIYLEMARESYVKALGLGVKKTQCRIKFREY